MLTVRRGRPLDSGRKQKCLRHRHRALPLPEEEAARYVSLSLYIYIYIYIHIYTQNEGPEVGAGARQRGLLRGAPVFDLLSPRARGRREALYRGIPCEGKSLIREIHYEGTFLKTRFADDAAKGVGPFRSGLPGALRLSEGPSAPTAPITEYCLLVLSTIIHYYSYILFNVITNCYYY